MKVDFQKTKYRSNPEIKEQCKKRYQENRELHLIKSGIRNVKKRKVVIKFFNKYNKAPITFAQYAIETCINAVSDFLNMKNIRF